MTFGSLTLGECGELRLVEEVVLPIAREFDVETPVGDDCAIVPVNGSRLAVTADYGPTPLVWKLMGHENDLEAAGWLAVVVSASDVAAAGARPLCMTNCVDAPAHIKVDQLATYIRGYFRACAEFGFRNGGGDLRCGRDLAIRVAAVGICRHGVDIGRSGAKGGDELMVVGSTGRFMGTYLLASKGWTQQGGPVAGLAKRTEEILRFPRPQLDEMAALAEAGLVVAASDTSDGLLGAIDNLARASGCGFELVLHDDMLPEVVREAAASAAVQPWNVYFAWGDWAVAVVVRSRDVDSFRAVCSERQIQWTALGRATTGKGGVVARLDGGTSRRMEIVRNENFVAKSFSGGVDAHLEYLLTARLFEDGRGGVEP